MSDLPLLPSFHKFSRLALFQTPERFYLLASHATSSLYRVVRIERGTPELELSFDPHTYTSHELQTTISTLRGIRNAFFRVPRAYGLFGFVKLTKGWYVVLITDRAKVAEIGANVVYEVRDTVMVSLFDADDGRKSSSSAARWRASGKSKKRKRAARSQEEVERDKLARKRELLRLKEKRKSRKLKAMARERKRAKKKSDSATSPPRQRPRPVASAATKKPAPSPPPSAVVAAVAAVGSGTAQEGPAESQKTSPHEAPETEGEAVEVSPPEVDADASAIATAASAAPSAAAPAAPAPAPAPTRARARIPHVRVFSAGDTPEVAVDALDVVTAVEVFGRSSKKDRDRMKRHTRTLPPARGARGGGDPRQRRQKEKGKLREKGKGRGRGGRVKVKPKKKKKKKGGGIFGEGGFFGAIRRLFRSKDDAREKRYVDTLARLDLSQDFYFSYTYDLSRTLQSNILSIRKASQEAEAEAEGEVEETPDALNTEPRPAFPRRDAQTGIVRQSFPNEEFVWNGHLLKPLRAALNSAGVSLDDPLRCDVVLPIIHGCVVEDIIRVLSNRCIHVIVIGRRSRLFAGTRYKKRGLCHTTGDVANFVETEQIVYDKTTLATAGPAAFGVESGPVPGCQCCGKFSSYVQTRGSVPLSWSQTITTKMITPKPQIRFNQFDPFFAPARKHFDRLRRVYGNPIIVLNLLKAEEKKPREIPLNFEFERCVAELNRTLPTKNKILYIASDFRHNAKDSPATCLNEMTRHCEDFFARTSFFCTSKGKWRRFQNGVVRSNCVDGLDRTNISQFMLGLHSLGHQLCALGVLDRPNDVLQHHQELIGVLILLYQQLGDQLALQYGGSQTVSSGIDFRGYSWDVLTSVKRYYSNNFTDDDKQCAMNLFLGAFDASKDGTDKIKGAKDVWDLKWDYYLHEKVVMIEEQMRKILQERKQVQTIDQPEQREPEASILDDDDALPPRRQSSDLIELSPALPTFDLRSEYHGGLNVVGLEVRDGLDLRRLGDYIPPVRPALDELADVPLQTDPELEWWNAPGPSAPEPEEKEELFKEFETYDSQACHKNRGDYEAYLAWKPPMSGLTDVSDDDLKIYTPPGAPMEETALLKSYLGSAETIFSEKDPAISRLRLFEFRRFEGEFRRYFADCTTGEIAELKLREIFKALRSRLSVRGRLRFFKAKKKRSLAEQLGCANFHSDCFRGQDMLDELMLLDADVGRFRDREDARSFLSVLLWNRAFYMIRFSKGGFVDGPALYRFFPVERLVLNESESVLGVPPVEDLVSFSAELVRTVKKKKDGAVKKFQVMARALQFVDLSSLRSAVQKNCFYLNLFNALYIASRRSFPGLFKANRALFLRRFSLVVARRVISMYDLKYRILFPIFRDMSRLGRHPMCLVAEEWDWRVWFLLADQTLHRSSYFATVDELPMMAARVGKYFKQLKKILRLPLACRNMEIVEFLKVRFAGRRFEYYQSMKQQ